MSRILFVTEINKTLLSSGYISFSIMYLSALAKKAGHQCEVTPVEYKEVERIFREFSPDIVAYSAFTGPHVPMININHKLKQKYKFFSMFGGPHPTYFPEVIEEGGIDAICIGEGFEAFTNFLDKLEKGEDITQTPNWWVKKNGKVYKNPVAHQVKYLDELPFIDRSIFDKYPYYKNSKSISFMTSLGCPYKCSYCFNHLAHKMLKDGDKIIRQRSVNNVIEEIKQVKSKYPLEFVEFRDDIFALNKKWIKEFSIKYPREIGLPFVCLIRPNLVTEDIIDDLKKAGVYHIAIAIEAGNDYIRNVVLKRNMSRETILKAAQIMHDRNVKFLVYDLLGNPGETFDTVLETWDLTVKCKPSFAWASLMTPYPRTDIYDYAVANGYLDPEKLKKYPDTYHEYSILKLPDKRKIENFHKLFQLAVAFPSSISIIKILVNLPLGKFYNLIRKFLKGYSFKYKLYPKVARKSFKETVFIAFDTVFKSKA